MSWAHSISSGWCASSSSSKLERPGWSWVILGHPGSISACGSFQSVAKFIYVCIYIYILHWHIYIYIYNIWEIWRKSESEALSWGVWFARLEVSPGHCDLLPHPGVREQRGLLDIIWSGRGRACLGFALLWSCFGASFIPWFSMDFPWIFRGFSMGFPWFSIGFPWFFLCW